MRGILASTGRYTSKVLIGPLSDYLSEIEEFSPKNQVWPHRAKNRTMSRLTLLFGAALLFAPPCLIG